MREQEVEIYLNCVGKLELPHEEVELAEEEKAELERLGRKRARAGERVKISIMLENVRQEEYNNIGFYVFMEILR